MCVWICKQLLHALSSVTCSISTSLLKKSLQNSYHYIRNKHLCLVYPCGVSGAELPLLTFDHRRHQICACWWIGIPCSFSQLFPLRLQSHKSDQIFVFFVPKNSNRIHLLGSFHYLCHTWICASTHSPKTPKLQCHKTYQSFPYKLWWFICWMIHPTAASEVCHWLNWNFIPFPALTVTLHSTFQLFKTFPIPNICLWGAH